jgi:DNA-binding transcriptional regulator YiaG
MAISAQEIREIRLKLGYTQVKLAEQLGLTKWTVAHWEQGRFSPSGSSEKLLRLLEAGVGKWRKRKATAPNRAKPKARAKSGLTDKAM